MERPAGPAPRIRTSKRGGMGRDGEGEEMREGGGGWEGEGMIGSWAGWGWVGLELELEFFSSCYL